MAEYEHPVKDRLWDNGFEILPFKDLPKPYQLAMAWYMAIDGEAWAEAIDEKEFAPLFVGQWTEAERHGLQHEILRRNLSEIIHRYGDEEFGVATWPTSELIVSIAHDQHLISEQTIEKTIEDYGSDVGPHYYRGAYPEQDRWPVILSSHPDETLEDGWHRFGFYARSGYADTPVMFYPKDCHYEMRRSPGLQRTSR